MQHFEMDEGEPTSTRMPNGRSGDGKLIKIDKSVNIIAIIQLLLIIGGGIFALGAVSTKLEANTQTVIETKAAVKDVGDKLDKQVDRLDKRIDTIFFRNP